MSGSARDDRQPTGDGALASAELDAPPTPHGDGSMADLLGRVAHAPAARPPLDLSPGTIVDGTFRIMRTLGSGGMGVVHLARDLGLHREVALKVHRAATGLDRLQREAIAMAQLAHPNVVTVHAVGQVDGRLYVAMEYVQGLTLRAWVAAARRSWREIVRTVVSAGEGLAAAHAAGFVHRDFKPENVLVGRDGRPRVGDFGLVRHAGDTDAGLISPLAETIDAAGGQTGAAPGADPAPTTPDRAPTSPPLTVTGAAIGTPAYMAPEQFAGGVVDARADQFAFCVVLYEALCGRRPFGGDDHAALRAQVAGGQVQPLSRRHAPTWLWRALRRGLSPDPADRWPDLRALLDELIDAPRRRRRAAIVAGAAAVAVAAAAYPLAVPDHRLVAAPGCDHAGAGLDTIWDAERADATRARLADADAAAGPVHADRIVGAVDAWGQRFRRAAVEACRAERIDRTWSQRTAALARGCRRRALRDLAAVLAGLDRADRASLPRRSSDVQALFPIEDCVDERVLVADHQVPDDPRLAGQVIALERDLAELEDAADLEAARAGLDAVWPQVERLGFAPLTAAALRTDGVIARRERRFVVAIDRLERAFATARSAGANAIALEASRWLIWIHGVELHKLDAARAWIIQAVPDAERYGLRHLPAARVVHAAAVVAEISADHARAIALHRRLVETWRGVDDALYAKALGGLGSALDAAGRDAEAVVAYEEALGVVERAGGPGDPSAGVLRSNLVVALIDSGDAAGGLAVAERATALLAEPSVDDAHAAGVRFNLGFALQMNGRRAEAVEVYREVRDAFVRLFGPDSADVADVDANLGVAYLELDRVADARPHLERALAIRRAHYGEEHEAVADAYAHVGRAALRAGACAEARPHLERAIAAYQAVTEKTGSVQGRIADPLTGLARCARLHGHGDDAIALLIRARRAADDGAAPRRVRFAVLVELGWAYAEARQLGLARDHLIAARPLATGDDPDATASVAEIDRWLAANP
jgi:eukaryotic-like serine/threonine-protein kinase